MAFQGGIAERAQSEGRVFDALDIGMIEAGERSGDLTAALDLLSAHYKRIVALRRALLAKSMYPFLLFHLAVLLLSIAPAISARDPSLYFARVAVGLGSFYLLLGILFSGVSLIFRACRSLPLADHLLFSIPLIGAARQNQAAARFASVLSMQVRAGIGILAALPRAGNASGSAFLREISAGIAQTVREGGELGVAFAASRAFPSTLEDAVRTGEASGRLDSELLRAAEILREKNARTIDRLAEWLPRIFYLCVAAFVGWRIIAAVQGYYQGIQNLMEDF